jgi:uncharacterized ferritin-like protein (DUF455 family)
MTALESYSKNLNAPVFTASAQELRSAALRALQASDVEQKLALTGELYAVAATFLIANHELPEPPNLPGRPPKPLLLPHLSIAQRSPHTREGLAALIHAVAHIEFNAINLALDAVWRFAGMPRDYYLDWLRVACEEAQHFALLRALLQDMDADYGSFAAHTGLWDMTERTKGDITARMALVPRTLEARGLDATPPMQAKLRKVGTPHALRAVEILDVILRDEVGHVAVGNRWYRWLCEREGLEPVAHYKQLRLRYQAPRLRAPFNTEARRLAGFTDEELRAMLD